MKFKCKITGLIYNYEHAVDIISMQQHPTYEEVKTSQETHTEVPKTTAKTTSKKAKVTPDESNIDGA